MVRKFLRQVLSFRSDFEVTIQTFPAVAKYSPALSFTGFSDELSTQAVHNPPLILLTVLATHNRSQPLDMGLAITGPVEPCPITRADSTTSILAGISQSEVAITRRTQAVVTRLTEGLHGTTRTPLIAISRPNADDVDSPIKAR